MPLANFLLPLLLLAAVLAGCSTAQPIDASTNLSSTLAARDWAFGPSECSSQNWFCITIEKVQGHWGGFKHIYCTPHHALDQGNTITYFFNGYCEGQLIMNCPTAAQGNTGLQRGLVDFNMGSHQIGSTFFTDSPLVKGVTSDSQVVEAGAGTIKVKARFADLYATCRYE